MLYDSLVAESRRNDSLDGVRSAALERVRWLADLLEHQRIQRPRGVSGLNWREKYEKFEAMRAVNRAETDRRLADCADEEGRAAALCLVLAAGFDDTSLWDYRGQLSSLVSRLDGWTPDEVAVMLLRVTEYKQVYWLADSLGLVLKAAERLGPDECRAVAPWLEYAHAELVKSDVGASQHGPLAKRMRVLLASVDEARIPEGLVPPYAPWAAPLRDRAASAPTVELARFLRHLTSPSGPRPAQRWRRTCVALVDAAAARDVVGGILLALAEGEPLCSRGHGPHTAWHSDGFHYHYVVHQNDRDLARGVVWAGALTAGAAAVPYLRALALRTSGAVRSVTEDLKLSGAAINALAEIGDPAALEALWRLQAQIKHRALRKQLDTALVTAAARQGITAEQLIERSVPDHGLATDGALERDLGGGYRARVAIEDAAKVRLSFVCPDGQSSRTAPAAVKDGFPDALKEAKALAKEVRATLSGERARVEALLSAGRSWPYDEWRRIYRDHSVTGVISRGLIWEFEDADGTWHAALPLTVPAGEPRQVRLWHPITASMDEVRAWRERIVEERLRQPFKQAFREIYLRTPAEEGTGVYSNRFAAHIVHYLRLYALFKERGWQANFLGRHDGGYEGQARGEFADGQWRACFHHEPATHDFDYAPDHAATDQVRFERRDGRRWREAPLADVPPLVFSEAMRDVDLFVGVTSIAADPEWADRGEDRHTAYWRTTTFGELTASAEARRDVLERIVPRLRIAGRCSLEGRFLVVRGDLGTYKIHLGSANILMEPDDAYLCIVPSGRRSEGKVFLPFEDERLSLILSKAVLLAADSAITDTTILRQIKRGA
jgi:hypothetical protein